MSSQIPTPSQLLNKSDLQRLLRVSASTLDRMVAAGRLPAPVELGPRTRRWSRTSVEAWIDAGCPDSADVGS